MAVQYKKQKDKALREQQFPDDLGLMENTFIMPYGKNRPSWFSDFKRRRKLEGKRWKTRWAEFVAAFAYRYIIVRPRPRLNFFQISDIAKDLHKSMFEHFSAGNLEPIQWQLCTGLLDSLRARIAQRPPGVYLKWKLDSYIKEPRLVSYKVVQLPSEDTRTARNALVQAVVCIHSLQSLMRVKKQTVKDSGLTGTLEALVDAEGRVLHEGQAQGGQMAKETIEYVVVQKVMRKSKEQSWKVWGMASETTLESLERQKNKSMQGAGRAGPKV